VDHRFSQIDASRFRSLLNRAVALPVVALLALAAFFFWQTQNLRSAARMTDRAGEIIAQAHLVERLVIDGETGLRGFLITGKDEFLEPYLNARRRFFLESDELISLVAGDPTWTTTLNEIRARVNDWIELAEATIQHRRGKKQINETAQSEAKRLTDVIRAQFDELIRLEEGSRRALAAESRATARWTVTSSTIAAIILGLILAVYSRRLLFLLTDSYAKIVADLNQQTSNLEKAVRSRDEFLSVASHELKTPLTSLKLQLQMTQRAIKPERQESPPLEKLKRVVDMCFNQSLRLTELIEELLDVSRIQSGKLSFNFDDVDLTELVRENIDKFAEQFVEAKTELSFDAGTPVLATCERFPMEQVCWNLLSNALKYGGSRPVSVRVIQDDRYAQIVIQDQGIGIEAEKVPLIFDKFERVAEGSGIGGLGLGLFISRQIIIAHRGTIEVESKLNQGSTFTVRIPLKSDQGKFTKGLRELAEA